MRFNPLVITAVVFGIRGVEGSSSIAEFGRNKPLTEALDALTSLKWSGYFSGGDEGYHAQLVKRLQKMSDRAATALRKYLRTEQGVKFMEQQAGKYRDYPKTRALFLAQVEALLPPALDKVVYMKESSLVASGFSGRLVALPENECLTLLEEIGKFDLHLTGGAGAVKGAERVAKWASLIGENFPYMSYLVQKILSVDTADFGFVCKHHMLSHVPTKDVLDWLKLSDYELATKNHAEKTSLKQALVTLEPCLTMPKCDISDLLKVSLTNTFVRSALVVFRPSEFGLSPANIESLTSLWKHALENMGERTKVLDIYTTMTEYARSRYAVRSDVSVDAFVEMYIEIKEKCMDRECDKIREILSEVDGSDTPIVPESLAGMAMKALEGALKSKPSIHALTHVLNFGDSAKGNRKGLIRLLRKNPEMELTAHVFAYIEALPVRVREALLSRGMRENAFGSALDAAALIALIGPDRMDGDGGESWALNVQFVQIVSHPAVEKTIVSGIVLPAISAKLDALFADPSCADDGDVSKCAEVIGSDFVVNVLHFQALVESKKGCLVIPHLLQDDTDDTSLEFARSACAAYASMTEGWMFDAFYVGAVFLDKDTDTDEYPIPPILDALFTDPEVVMSGFKYAVKSSMNNAANEETRILLAAISGLADALPYKILHVEMKLDVVIAAATDPSETESAYILLKNSPDKDSDISASVKVRKAFVSLLSLFRSKHGQDMKKLLEEMEAELERMHALCFRDTEGTALAFDHKLADCAKLVKGVLFNHVWTTAFVVKFGCRDFANIVFWRSPADIPAGETKCEEVVKQAGGSSGGLLDMYAAKSVEIGDAPEMTSTILFLSIN